MLGDAISKILPDALSVAFALYLRVSGGTETGPDCTSCHSWFLTWGRDMSNDPSSQGVLKRDARAPTQYIGGNLPQPRTQPTSLGHKLLMCHRMTHS
jgi:hypothetical protein